MTNAATKCETCDGKGCINDGSRFGKSCHCYNHKTGRSELRQTNDAPTPPTLQLRARAHIAMRTWLESEFGADELHEQRIVSAMKAIREQIGLAAQQPKIVAPPGFGHSFSCDCDECRPGSDRE